MTISEDLAQLVRPETPKEWQPYAEDNGTRGTGAALLPKPWNTHNDLLLGAGFDPREWQISGPINTRKWMRHDQEWLYYYKFDVVAGESLESEQAHIDVLEKLITRRRRPAPVAIGGEDAWAFIASDWQIGKAEGADGTDQTVDRVLESYDLAEREIKNLRRIGRRMPTGLFAGTGDLVEGTCGFYPGMSFLIDRNRREQNRITRDLLYHGIDRFLPYFDQLIVTTVGGNHGENRDDGKKVTDDGDNDDVAVFEAVREAYQRASGDNISWVIPESELSLSLFLGGVSVGFTHGHLFKGGAARLSPQRGAIEWWMGQDFGFAEVRGTQILISSHFHHHSVNTFGHRTHIQTPAMDPGSQWVANATGQKAPAAALTVRFDASQPLGYADLALLSPSLRR